MAIGDQQDCLNRLTSVLPRWFGDIGSAPILGGLLTGMAWAMSFVYSLYAYAALQTRILTATDGWLDMIAGDWFGLGLQRRAGQADVSYRALILAWMFRERATRKGLIKVLQDVTGRTPVLIEPNRGLDSGGYKKAYGYNSAGAYGGAASLPRNAVFLVAYRPLPGTPQYGVQDADIFAAIEAVRPAATIVWMQLQN